MQRALFGLVLLLLACGSANSRIVTLSFDGTYDTAGGAVFGQTGAAVPYSFQITYDTALDTNTEFFGTGVLLGAFTTIHDWYGYSASGITATTLTFGTQTWTSGDLNARIPGSGVPADLWFDTDLNSSTPSLAWILFDATNGFLQLGGGRASAGNIFMRAGYSSVSDSNEGSNGSSSNMLISSDIDVDGDGLAEQQDNCTLVANPTQLDADQDGYGNRCDGDFNNASFANGWVNTVDYAIFRSVMNKPSSFSSNAANADLDGDGVVDTVDYSIFRSLINKVPGPSGYACAGTVPCP